MQFNMKFILLFSNILQDFLALLQQNLRFLILVLCVYQTWSNIDFGQFNMKFVRDSANVGLKMAKFRLVAIWTGQFQIFEIFSALQFNMK